MTPIMACGWLLMGWGWGLTSALLFFFFLVSPYASPCLGSYVNLRPRGWLEESGASVGTFYGPVPWAQVGFC